MEDEEEECNVYVVVVEILRNGYIVKAFVNEDEAINYKNKLLYMSLQTSYGNTDYLIDKFNKVSCIQKYQINNREFGWRSRDIVTDDGDGQFSTYVLEVDLNTFCIQTFVKERELPTAVFKNIREELSHEFPIFCNIAN